MSGYVPTYGMPWGATNGTLADKSYIRAQSFCVTPIELLGDECKDLSIHGTGFFYSHNEKSFLVTNWHNLSGLNPFTYRYLSGNQVLPRSVRFYIVRQTTYGDGKVSIGRAPITLPLYEEWDQLNWLEHSDFDGQRIDLAAIQIPRGATPEWHVTDGDDFDLLSMVGSDVYIVGYPFKNYVGSMPGIWKRGSLASEPMIAVDGRPMFLIDAASRPGMSGSPVFRHQFGPAVDKSLSTKLDNVVTTKFVGVYSGHLDTAVSEITLGFAWSSHLVDELVANPKMASRRLPVN